MIQIAMLVVLIVIALILAPWLLAIIAAGIAAYGVYLIAVALVFLISFVAVLAWLLVRHFAGRDRSPVEIKGPRKPCSSCSVEMPAAARRCPGCGAGS